MKRHFGNIIKKSYVYALFFTLLCQVPSLAQNMLSEIQINPDGNSYQILLRTEKPVPIKKVIESSSKIYIELQSVEPTVSVSTVYNNVPNIKNVVVEPSSKGSVRISVQGKNADKSKVGFESLREEAAVPPAADTIELNPPIEAYNNIYQSDTERDANMYLPVKSLIIPALKQAKNLIGTKMMYFLGFILILAFGARMLRKNSVSAQKTTPIGLSRNLEQADSIEEKSSLTSLPKRRLSARPDSTVTNYGLKSYQDSQRSPYATPYRTPSKRYNTPAVTVPNSANEIQSAPLADLKSKLMTATLNSHASGASQGLKMAGRVDSAKFIESMTKIYEKNGRLDLAEGLKNSLKKMHAKVK